MGVLTYGWLLLWVYAGGFLLPKLQYPNQHLEKTENCQWELLPALLLVLPLVIFAGWRTDSLGDTALYRRLFLQLQPSFQTIGNAFRNGEKDPGFTALSVLLKMLLGNRAALFFLLIAALQMICVALVFRKYAWDYRICIFLFIASTDYLSWMHNGTRQFLAVAIVFAGYRFLLERRYLLMVMLILLASLFHISALLMLPVIFLVQGKAWNIKLQLVLAVTVLVMVFITPVSQLLHPLLRHTPYADVLENEIWAADDGVNIIRVAVYSVPAVLSLIGLRYVRQSEDPKVHLCVNLSVITMALYLVAMVSSGIYIGRLPIYTTLYGYMVLPWLIDNIFEPRSARLVRISMQVLYILFFCYQTMIVWGGV